MSRRHGQKSAAAAAGTGTPAADLAARLASAAEKADHGEVMRLARQAVDAGVAAPALGVLSFAVADLARRLAVLQAEKR